MKNFYDKNKQIIHELIAFTFVVIGLLVFLNFNHLTIGRLGDDFANQHIRLIDYLRNNFWATGDFFPQINFNLGGSQNIATLYYYGLYNPLIMLSYFFPFISTLYWMQIVFLIMIVATFLGMNLLLRSFKIKREYVLVISVLVAFSPPLMFHFSYHLMFIYYFPVFIFSLLAIEKLITKGIKWPFIVCFSLAFYTNFFFILVIGFVQLTFLITSIHFRYKFNKSEMFKKYKDFFIGCLVGTSIGMFTFLPQVLALFSGNRVNDVAVEIPMFFDGFAYNLVSNIYAMGLGVLGVTTLIIGLLNYRKKFTFVWTLIILFTMMSAHFIYLLNVFQYVHQKVFIFFVPIIFLLLALFVNDKEIRYKKQATLIGMIIASLIFLLSENKHIVSERLFLIALFIQALLLLVMFSNNLVHKKKYIIILVVMNSFLVMSFSTTLVSKKEYNKELILKSEKRWNQPREKELDFSYTNDEVNFVSSLTTFAPLQYTSILNSEYIDFYTNFINAERYKSERNFKRTAISNSLYANFLGIKKQINNDRTVKYYENARPFIYGVSNDEVYRTESLMPLDSTKRLLALNDALFIEKANRDYVMEDIPIKSIYLSQKNLEFEKDEDVVIDISDNVHEEGIYIIESNVVSEKVNKAKVSVNEHISYVKPFKKIYREKERRDLRFHIDASKDLKQLKVEFEGSQNVYDHIKVSFIPQSYIDNFTIDYIKSTDNKMIDNEALSFKMNMKKNGYLATSFFYDQGFKIFDNGKEITKEKINNNFLGAKLAKGEHNILIKYEIPGLKVGLVLSLFGLFILAFYVIDEVKIFNRPFFRFVLVGSFNTINYFVCYSILIMALPYMVAHIASFIYSAFVSYFLTSYYTFKTKPTLKTFLAFPLTFLPNLVFSGVGTAFLVEFGLVDKSIASLIVMILIIPITFIINKLIFKKDK